MDHAEAGVGSKARFYLCLLPIIDPAVKKNGFRPPDYSNGWTAYVQPPMGESSHE
jgi:hypothetical protein